MNVAKFLIAISFVFTVACSRDGGSATPTYYSADNPEYLSAWGMLGVDKDHLTLAERVLPYDLATPLFSDYALKLRTVWMPANSPAAYNDNTVFDFPLGTVITKTFYYPTDETGAVLQASGPVLTNGSLDLANVRLVETRLLVRRETGWDALPYVWNDDQSEAVLKRIGDIKPMILVRTDGRAEEFPYIVPNANQCAGCHATNATSRAIEPIGPKARHLNKAYSFGEPGNQLAVWSRADYLTGFDDGQATPQNIDWSDEELPLAARARSYLDANCSHCHNPKGAADTSGLNLEPDASGPALGVCKSPIAAGGGTGGRPFGILPGNPDTSITVHRLETTDPGAMMPELGRAVTHEEGVDLISRWIAEMDGDCA